jgi:hypothetical protein
LRTAPLSDGTCQNVIPVEGEAFTALALSKDVHRHEALAIE